MPVATVVTGLGLQEWLDGGATVPLPPALQGAFHLPPAFEYGATFAWAVSGALVAARRGYDVSGLTALALVSATGGGLLRDVLVRREPDLFRPGTLVATAAAAGVALYLALTAGLGFGPPAAGEDGSARPGG